jgi:ABC-type dipeptide/oligopeptide/nickel transport system permease subunit
VQWATEVLLAFPGILLTLAVSAVLGPGLTQAMVAIGLASIPFYVRLVRGTTLGVVGDLYIKAARAWRWRRPRGDAPRPAEHCRTPDALRLDQARDGGADGLGAGLPGLGAQPPTPEWGGILAEGRNYMRQAWWITMFPGLAIIVTVLGFKMLGDGLRDAFDATLQG